MFSTFLNFSQTESIIWQFQISIIVINLSFFSTLGITALECTFAINFTCISFNIVLIKQVKKKSNVHINWVHTLFRNIHVFRYYCLNHLLRLSFKYSYSIISCIFIYYWRMLDLLCWYIHTRSKLLVEIIE